jgi:hypothetical protein
MVLKVHAKNYKTSYYKGRIVDHIKLVKLNNEGRNISPKYCKQIRGLHYLYGGYGGHEIDFNNLSSIICLITLTKDVET